MRLLFLSVVTFFTLILGAASAQNSGGGASMQLPVGQTFKNFTFPVYQDGKLTAMFTAAEATGITQNRAATTDVKIELYDNGAVSTTITSPKADLYVSERKLRTKNTVRIKRDDMDATAQTCDFDQINKKYVLRTQVRVVLKNFDAGSKLASESSTTPTPASGSTPEASTPPTPAAPAPRHSLNNESLLDSPGAYSSTNSAPIPPSDTK